MIEIIKGHYGHLVNGEVIRINAGETVELSPEREAQLVDSGFAKKVPGKKKKKEQANDVQGTTAERS